MHEESLTLSEDDIRTKIVYQWLKDCGLNDTDIHIEYSINIRLGKGIKTIHSRTDILVRNSQNMNLLIIEIKRPDHCLNDEDKLQGLSYARVLAKGGIAPFTILNSLVYEFHGGIDMEFTFEEDSYTTRHLIKLISDKDGEIARNALSIFNKCGPSICISKTSLIYTKLPTK